MSNSSLSIPLNSTVNITSPLINNTTNKYISSLSLIEKTTFQLSYYLFNNKYGVYLSHITLVLVALSIIITASNAALSRPKSAPKLTKSHPEYSKLSTSSNSNQDFEKFIGENYAFATPILAAISLTSLYYGMKKIDKSNISWFFNNYALVFSFFAFHEFFQFVIHTVSQILIHKGYDLVEIIPRLKLTLSQDDNVLEGSDVQTNYLYETSKGEKPYLEFIEEDFERPSIVESKDQISNIYISTIDIFATIISTLLGVYYFKTQDKINWIFANFVAWCFAFGGITKLHLSSFKVGFILLTGLFFYDIYFVFKTDIMVTVATNIEIPIMMRLPSGQNYENITIDPSIDYIVPKLPFSMLGLGDIVVPGSFIAMLYRYDLFKHHESNSEVLYNFLNSFHPGYFVVGLISYIIGLILTFIGLHVSDLPQPALLYLSPSLIFGVIGYSLWLGEFNKIWKYTEIDEDEQKRRKEFEKKKEEEKKKRQEEKKKDSGEKDESDIKVKKEDEEEINLSEINSFEEVEDQDDQDEDEDQDSDSDDDAIEISRDDFRRESTTGYDEDDEASRDSSIPTEINPQTYTRIQDQSDNLSLLSNN